MEINDEYISKYFSEYKKNHKRIDEKYFDKNIIIYLQNRYKDSESLKESLYRILNNIEIRPVCKVCRKHINFINLNRGFCNYCSNICAQNDKELIDQIKNTKIKKYGQIINYEKIKETLLRKYGVSSTWKIEGIKEKSKETKIKKYNNGNYNNIEKSKETCLEKYGTEYYLNSNDCKEKTIKKLGTDNYRKTEESKNKVSKYHKNHKEELNKKRKETYLKKFNVDNPMKNEEIKNKFNWVQQKIKEYETKKKNNSFNISKPEDESYDLLKTKYPDIIRQYKSDLYPFACDFYIPSLDLYIECNYHWTHGYKLFEGTKEDNIKLEEWQHKNTEYYNNAIYTWTILDIKKYNISKENKLNYKIFYNINELKKWIKL